MRLYAIVSNEKCHKTFFISTCGSRMSVSFSLKIPVHFWAWVACAFFHHFFVSRKYYAITCGAFNVVHFDVHISRVCAAQKHTDAMVMTLRRRLFDACCYSSFIFFFMCQTHNFFSYLILWFSHTVFTSFIFLCLYHLFLFIFPFFMYRTI